METLTDSLAAFAPFFLLAVAGLCGLIQIFASIADHRRRRHSARTFGNWPAANPEDDLETFQTGAAELPSSHPLSPVATSGGAWSDVAGHVAGRVILGLALGIVVGEVLSFLYPVGLI